MKLIKILMTSLIDALMGIIKCVLILCGIMYLYEYGVLDGIITYVDNIINVFKQ